MFSPLHFDTHSLSLSPPPPPSRASLVGDTICLIAYFQPRWQTLAQGKGAAALSDFWQLRVVFSVSFNLFCLSPCRRFDDCLVIVLSAALLFNPCVLSVTFLRLSPPLAPSRPLSPRGPAQLPPTICAQTNSGRGDGRRAVAVVGVWGGGGDRGRKNEG